MQPRQPLEALCMTQGLKEEEKLGVGSLVVAGGLAGAAFWGPVYPADIVKSKIQVDSFTHPEYSGMMDCASKVWSCTQAFYCNDRGIRKHASMQNS